MQEEEAGETSANGAKASSVTFGGTSDLRIGNTSAYCPVCFHKLEQHQCKLVCKACGYYMSCSDYY